MSTRTGRLAAFATTLENAAAAPRRWLPLLLGWILLRNLLESFLEVPHELGFDWREEISFAMVVLHFPYFYLSLFVGLVLWLRVLTRRPFERLASVVAIGFGILLSAPLIDAFVSGGRGYDLRYMFGLGSILWRFWDPRAVVDAVSPGQRIEILLGCLLIGGYVFVARRRTGDRRVRGLALALAGGTGLFLWTAFLGAWPSLFARGTLPGAGGFESAYLAVYREIGLIASEVRRHALVMLIPLIALTPLLLRLAARDLCVCIRRGIPWSRLVYYTGLVPAGAYLGWLMYREFLPAAFHNPTDWLAVLVLWCAMIAAFLTALLWNDRYDLAADRINQSGRPLAMGHLPADQVSPLSLACAIVALLQALTVSYHAMLLVAAILFLAWAYSTPPLRLKRWPGIATATLALLSVASVATGLALFGQEMTPLIFPRRIAWTLLVAITLGFTAKDLKDARGDAETGVITLATLLPPRTARWATALLVASAYLCTPLILPLGWLFVASAILFAVVSFLLTIKLERPDAPLLVIFVLFAVLVLGFLAVQPALLDPAEAAFHAHLRSAEELLRAHLAVGDVSLADGARASLRAAFALLPAAWASAGGGAAIPAWSERCDWVQLRLPGVPGEASLEQNAVGEASRRLRVRKPLHPAYWGASFHAALEGRLAQNPRDLCDQALARGVRPGDFHRQRAAFDLAAERSAEADLRAALCFGQRRPVVWTLVGDQWQQRGEARCAEAAYRKALTDAPKLPDAWAGLGVVLHAEGRLADARAALSRARDLAPQDPWVCNNLGVVLRDLGELSAARETFLKAHALEPALFEAPYNLGILCLRQGEIGAARQWLQIARRLRPGFAPVEDALRRLEDQAP